jgi:hypothetical protein
LIDSITAAALLAASLFAKKMLEETGSKAGTALSAASGRLVAWLRHAGTRNPKVSSALSDIEASPDDPAKVEALGEVIAEQARGNDVLAHELMALADECRTAGDVLTIGGTHIHGDVSGGTVTQYGGSHIELHP